MTNQEKLGTIGEIYYQAIFGGLLSEYKYDGEKDLIQEDGTQVEIKTQSRLRGSNAFTVNKANKNNLNKCLYVDTGGNHESTFVLTGSPKEGMRLNYVCTPYLI
jgi:hypothetical protein